MTEPNVYLSDADETVDESIDNMDEIKTNVKRLADEAWATNPDSYKAYLYQYGQLIEGYVASTSSQNIRGAIFLHACEHDYHMPSEIKALPDDLPLILTQAQNEDKKIGPSLN